MFDQDQLFWKEEACRLSKSCSCTSTGVRSTAKSVRPPNFESHSWRTTCGITRTWDVWHESRHIGDCIWKLDVPRNSDPCKTAFSPCLWTSFSQVFECLIGLICTYSSKSPRPWIWRFPSLSLSRHFAMLGTLPLANQVDCVPFLNWQVMFIYIVSTLNCSPGAWIAMTLSCSAHHFTAYASLFYSLFNHLYPRNCFYMILQLVTGRDTHSKQEPRRPDQSPRPTLGHLHRLRSANTKNHP